MIISTGNLSLSNNNYHRHPHNESTSFVAEALRDRVLGQCAGCALQTISRVNEGGDVSPFKYKTPLMIQLMRSCIEDSTIVANNMLHDVNVWRNNQI